MKKLTFCLLTISLLGCKQQPNKAELIAEVRAAEQAFNDYAATYGMKEAFAAFAHEDGVIKRGDSIYQGIAAISSYYENQTLLNTNLQWKPDFIDVASSGDMAYTYGKYTFYALRPDSSEINASGIFHTVWKQDENGDWKYVYD